jgi:hypothetical protein
MCLVALLTAHDLSTLTTCIASVANHRNIVNHSVTTFVKRILAVTVCDRLIQPVNLNQRDTGGVIHAAHDHRVVARR